MKTMKRLNSVVRYAIPALALVLLLQALPNTANAAPPIHDGDTQALIDAIAAGGTIKLVANSTYVLNGSHIEIDQEVIINGRGSTIDGDDLSRVFFVTSNGDLTLNNLTVTGGGHTFDGAGIFNDGGTVTLNGSSSVSHNTAADDDSGGGGIANIDGTVTLNDNSSVSHNTADDDGGGIANSGGTVILNDSSIINQNFASTLGGGIVSNGTITLNDSSSISHNTADDGGGIFNFGGTLNNAIDGGNVRNNTPNDIVNF